MKNKVLPLVLIIFLVSNFLTLSAHHPVGNMNESPKEIAEELAEDQLLIVWTSADPDVAHKMVFMYAYNAQKNGWWKQVTLLVWGPSAKLSSEDAEIQEALKKMKQHVDDKRKSHKGNPKRHGQYKLSLVILKGHSRSHCSGKSFGITAEHHTDTNLSNDSSKCRDNCSENSVPCLLDDY